MKKLQLRTPKYNEYIHSFRVWLGALGYVESTVEGVPNMLKEFLYYLENNFIPDLQQLENHKKDVTGAYIEYIKVRENSCRGGALSPSFINRHIDLLYRFSEYVSHTEHIRIPVNVMRLKKEQKTDQVILSIEEIKLLYQATDKTPYGMRDRAALALYYGSGLRRSEGINLDVSDILFDRKLIYIRKAKNSEQRYVPVTTGNLKHLEEYLYNARPLLVGEARKEAALLISERGRRINQSSVYLRLKALQHKAQIQKEIGVHTLRHSIATHLLQKGMSLENIALLLGHKCLDSTQIYTHIIHANL